MDYKKPLRLIKNYLTSQKKINKFQDATARVLPKLTCIDVGASYYPHPDWEVLRKSENTLWIAVEPNVENLEYLKTWRYRSKVESVCTGLSEKGGKQTLYKTNVDSGSSLCKPVINEFEAYRYDSNYYFPLKEIQIETITLDQVVKKYADNTFVSIKLDTQGSELSILKGLDQSTLVNKLICVDIEVSLRAIPDMQGSAHFFEVQKFLEDSGFELVRLKPYEGNLPKNNTRFISRNVLNECDAVFLIKPEVAYNRGEDCLRALLGFYVAYQLYGEAEYLLRKLQNNSNQLGQFKKDLAIISDFFIQ